jgi:FkbM family methyltransferase
MEVQTLTQLTKVKYGQTQLLVRKEELFVFYATFIANEYCRLRMRPGDTVLDFGANVGDFTVKAASKLRGDGRVIAIEPSRKNIEIIRENLEMNNAKNVDICGCAISGSDGYVYLDGDGSVISRASPDANEKKERVRALSIDSFLEEYGLKNRKDLVVKMDIEGAEKYAFKSMSFIRSIREISMELHGLENVQNIPRVLVNQGFRISQYKTFDEVRETMKSIALHPVDFLRLERMSRYLAFRGFLATINSKNPVAGISYDEFKIIYASRKT